MSTAKVPFGGLHFFEKERLEQVIKGNEADFIKSDGTKWSIDAFVIRDLAIGSYEHDIGKIPRNGIRISNAHIVGVLDLENIELGVTLAFKQCTFENNDSNRPGDAPILLRQARLYSLLLRSCEVIGGIVADDAYFQFGLYIRGTSVNGKTSFSNAKIDGKVDFRPSDGRASIFKSDESGSGVAIDAEGSRIIGSLQMSRAVVEGKMHLSNADIFGSFSAESASFQTVDYEAILANGVKIGGDWLMSSHDNYHRTKVVGLLSLAGAEIKGRLMNNNAIFSVQSINSRNIAINAESITIHRQCSFRNADITGKLRLIDASIRGVFSASNANFSRKKIFAINAENASISGDWFMNEVKINGKLGLRYANCHGKFRATGSVSNERDTAIDAYGLNVDGDVQLTGEKGGITINGQTLFLNAKVCGNFDAQNVTFYGSKNRPALTIDLIEIGKDFCMDNGLVCGNISARRTKIKGDFSCNYLNIIYNRHYAIDAGRINIDGSWHMRGATVIGPIFFSLSNIKGEVNFGNAAIYGSRLISLQGFATEIGDTINLNGLKSFGAIVLDRSTVKGHLRLKDSHLHSGFIAENLGDIADKDRASTMKQIFDDRMRKIKNKSSCEYLRRNIHDDIHTCITSIRIGRPNIKPEKFEQYAELVLSLEEAMLDGLKMPETSATRPLGIVDLTRCFGGHFDDYAAAWPPKPKKLGRTSRYFHNGKDIDHFVLDGFTYTVLENPRGKSNKTTDKARIDWLSGQNASDFGNRKNGFKPQPWVQVADYLANSGSRDDARRLYIERRFRMGKTKKWLSWVSFFPRIPIVGLPASPRITDRILFVTTFYGYNPWITVFWMLFSIWFFYFLVWSPAASYCEKTNCHDETVFIRKLTRNYSSPYDTSHQDWRKLEDRYPPFDPLVYSIDIFWPFVDFGQQEHWRPNTLKNGSVIDLPNLRFWINQLAKNLRGNSSSTEAHFSHVSRTIKYRIPLGLILYWCYLAEIVLGIILSSLAVMGFTGILKTRL